MCVSVCVSVFDCVCVCVSVCVSVFECMCVCVCSGLSWGSVLSGGEERLHYYRRNVLLGPEILQLAGWLAGWLTD